VAADIAVQKIQQAIAAADLRNPAQALQEAVVQASQAIYEQSKTEADQKGMGATCACALLLDDRLFTVSVGDSRIYLIRKDTIRQISTDHTWIQEAIEQGVLTPDQARNHPNAHVIRRYLGSRQPVIPDLRLRLAKEENDEQAESNQGLRLLPGDGLLLCSDGLSDLVESAEILHLLKTNDQETGIQKLIDLANSRGGHDNITIVSLQMPTAAELAVSKTVPIAVAPRPGMRWAWMGLATLILMGLILLGGLYLFVLRPVLFGAQDPTATRTQAALTQPAISTPAASSSPRPSATGDLIGATTTPAVTPLSATLTPWPTNTLVPTGGN
jgi:protein phosphatase